MAIPFHRETVSAFVREAHLSLDSIASALESRVRDAADMEPELEAEFLRSTVAVEQTAAFLGFDDVSRLSCVMAALLNARRRGEVAPQPEDLALLTRALDRLRQAVDQTAQPQGNSDVTPEIDAIRTRLTAAIEQDAAAAR